MLNSLLNKIVEHITVRLVKISESWCLKFSLSYSFNRRWTFDLYEQFWIFLKFDYCGQTFDVLSNWKRCFSSKVREKHFSPPIRELDRVKLRYIYW